MKRQKLIILLKELLKNSKRSDREISRVLGVSQPTITRTRARLEKEFIETYTVIPDFAKLEYQILAFTFIKMKSYPPTEEAQVVLNRASEWTGKHPNVVFAADGEGLGKDIVVMSFHKDYAKYSDFMRSFAMDWGQLVIDSDSFLVSLDSGFKIKPFNLRYLAEDL